MRTLLPYLVFTCLFSSSMADGQQTTQKSSTPKTTEGIGKSKLAEKPVEVLGGRLSVRMPHGARVEARPFPIMAAPESEEHETRVIFDAGQERLVLMAHESFALAGDNFEKEMSEWVAKWRAKYEIERFPLAVGGLKAVAVIPVNDPDRSRSDDATFVEGVFVQSEDRTIQSLDVYVNAAAENDLKECKALAQQILRSVAPGKKRLDMTAGERRLFAYTKEWEIAVTVPKNTVKTTQVGPDFLVHRLTVLGPLGSDSGGILIYVGGAPNFEPGVKKGEAMIFGKKVEWYSLAEGEGLQALCDLPIPDKHGLKSHIIVRAPHEARLKALKQAAETLKLVKPKDSLPN
jgi:hypothetical protein